MGNQDNNKLRLTSKSYLNGPDSTKLNTVDIWQPESESIAGQEGKLWLIYIHGGAWRDPVVDSHSFEPAVKQIWNSSSKNSIGGFASINYRLSPYPSHPENPSSPDDPSRNVHYPSHVKDVGNALIYLEGEYQISNRYILIGHSAGATMAFELHNSYFPLKRLPIPAAVLGIAGIYHFEAFLQAHSEIPAYKEFMDNAFPDKAQWQRAAPYSNPVPDSALWEYGKAVIISHSDQDELVEEGQASSMLEHIRMAPDSRERAHFLQASGNHDEIWGSGVILADLIAKSMDILRKT